MRKWVDLSFEIGELVYIKTDSDQKQRIVVSICLKQSGHIYELGSGNITSWHYDFEISNEINVLAKVTTE